MIAELNVAARIAGIAAKITGAMGWIGPVGMFLSPILGAAGDAIVAIVKGLFKGVAVAFANPAVLLVIMATTGGAYWYAWGGQQKKISAAHSAVIVMRSEVDRQCPETIAAKIRRKAGVKAAPKMETSRPWAPPGLSPF